MHYAARRVYVQFGIRNAHGNTLHLARYEKSAPKTKQKQKMKNEKRRSACFQFIIPWEENMMRSRRRVRLSYYVVSRTPRLRACRW